MFSLFTGRKYKFLSTLKPQDIVIINCPEPFSAKVGSYDITAYPVKVEVVGNDPRNNTILTVLKVRGVKTLLTLTYSNPSLTNVLLYNIYSSSVEAKEDVV